MAYGFGQVALANFLGFLVGLYFGYGNSSSDLLVVHAVGFIALFIGLLTMLKVHGLAGVPGGVLFGFGLGVSFASYFL